MLLVLASAGCGLYGFYAYDLDLQKEATSFAASAFNKVFLYHDEEFLQSNLKDGERPMSAHQFIAQLSATLGQPQWAGTLRGVFTTRLVAHRLMLTGRFQFPVLYEGSAPVWVNVDVSQIGNGWQIDHLGWEYQPQVHSLTR